MLALAYTILASVTAQTVMTGGESCSVSNGHPENGGYYVIGFSYKDITADEDPHDDSTYGDHGQKADDYRWETGITYPDALPKSCTPSRYSSCTYPSEITNLLTAHTCAILRFMYAAGSGSTVWKMTNNDTFQACDFTGATQIDPVSGLTGANGETLVDFPFEQDHLDQIHYFASESGCAAGQKVAVLINEEYSNTYDSCYSMGTETSRVQHCDCDHQLKPGSLAEVCGTGFIDGCKKELPDDDSCCPGDDGEFAGSGYSGKYVNAGNCIPKSKAAAFEVDAKHTYEYCTDKKNKDECDGFLDGDCPWWRVYSYGSWTYNTLTDGCDAPCPAMLRYGGRGAKVEDKPTNYGCDCDNSTYTATCDIWYMVYHCKKLENGETKETEEIDKSTCRMSQQYAAFKKHFMSVDKNDKDMWDSWLTPPDDDDDDEKESSITAVAAFSLMLAVFA
jgi:hypothetical protein